MNIYFVASKRSGNLTPGSSSKKNSTQHSVLTANSFVSRLLTTGNKDCNIFDTENLNLNISWHYKFLLKDFGIYVCLDVLYIILQLLQLLRTIRTTLYPRGLLLNVITSSVCLFKKKFSCLWMTWFISVKNNVNYVSLPF